MILKLKHQSIPNSNKTHVCTDTEPAICPFNQKKSLPVALAASVEHAAAQHPSRAALLNSHKNTLPPKHNKQPSYSFEVRFD